MDPIDLKPMPLLGISWFTPWSAKANAQHDLCACAHSVINFVNQCMLHCFLVNFVQTKVCYRGTHIKYSIGEVYDQFP